MGECYARPFAHPPKGYELPSRASPGESGESSPDSGGQRDKRTSPAEAAAPVPPTLENLSDPELAAAADAALEALTPRAQRFALAVAGGRSLSDAASEAGLSRHPSTLSRLKARAAEALRLLREQARRASLLTLDAAVQRFRELSEEARKAGDYGAATRALREASLLLGLYPEMRLKLNVEHSASVGVSAEEWEALARLRHQVREAPPASAAVVEAEVLPPALPAAPEESGSTSEGGTP